MSEPKPMASLTAGLLARKGDARPAMRRAFIPATPIAPPPFPVQNEAACEKPAPAAPPLVLVRQQQERIARSFSTPAKKIVGEAPQPRQARTAFTLRLDAERHLRLRLACAAGNRPAQQIVTQALDAFLEDQPGLAALVEQVLKDTARNG